MGNDTSADKIDERPFHLRFYHDVLTRLPTTDTSSYSKTAEHLQALSLIDASLNNISNMKELDDQYKARYDEDKGFIDFNELDFEHLDKPEGLSDEDYKKTLFV